MRARPGVLLALAFLAPAAVAPCQSLWRDDISRSMYADKRASRIGDIVTVVVQGTAAANRNTVATYIVGPSPGERSARSIKQPAYAINPDLKRDGRVVVSRSGSTLACLAVRVIDVLPNGNLVIEGKRESSLGGEQQTVLLRGLVRPEDITTDNTVLSSNVADASIHVITRGKVDGKKGKSGD
jgi:flagellar L-ring protein precursor FlgH